MVGGPVLVALSRLAGGQAQGPHPAAPPPLSLRKRGPFPTRSTCVWAFMVAQCGSPGDPGSLMNGYHASSQATVKAPTASTQPPSPLWDPDWVFG
jgi:hypothetical protein